MRYQCYPKYAFILCLSLYLSYQFMIMGKLLNGNKVGRQFWYMEDIYKDKARCDMYICKACNSSQRAIGHYHSFATRAWGVGRGIHAKRK